MALSSTANLGTKPRRVTRIWTLLACLAVIAVLSTAGVIAWRMHMLANRVHATLPTRPDLAGKPAMLGGLLTQAEQKAGSSSTRIDGMIELGRLYHANGFTTEAEACWRFARSEEPDEARWSYYLADLSRARSEYAGMTAFLEETLARAADYAPARLQLANLQFKSGELEQAERNYRLRLEGLPQDPYARLGLARVALQRGQTDEAKALLELLMKNTPHFSSGHNLYAELLAMAGDTAGASKHRWLGRETLRYREPEDPWLDELLMWCYDYDRLCVLGTIEFQTEQHDRAQEYFQRAIRVQPARPDAYELLAGVYLKKNDAVRARDLLEQALPQLTEKKLLGVFTTLSLAYRSLKEPTEAARIARLGLEHAGQQPELLDALGLALAESGRHEEAAEAWRAALVKNPGDANTNYNLAKSYLALRRLDDALDALDRSLTLQPSFLPTLLLRGEIEIEAGHLDLAEKYLRPAFESHPEEPQARRLLANWHLRSGNAAESKSDPDAAERHYREGLTLDENHAELLVRLGLFYLAHARASEAIGPLGAYHTSQPQNAPGCLFLGQAYTATNQRDKAREILSIGVQLAERSGNTKTANECRRLLSQL
jgi:tetratricopeptide (TPR) repeat protein